VLLCRKFFVSHKNSDQPFYVVVCVIGLNLLRNAAKTVLVFVEDPTVKKAINQSRLHYLSKTLETTDKSDIGL
jgi:hypothetical protein